MSYYLHSQRENIWICCLFFNSCMTASQLKISSMISKWSFGVTVCCKNSHVMKRNKPAAYFWKDICRSEWSMHSKYLVNSAKQFCFTLPKNSKPQRVTSLPSDKHFRGSGSSLTHSMNSCTQKNRHLELHSFGHLGYTAVTPAYIKQSMNTLSR